MNVKSKNEIRDVIVKDMLSVYDRCVELSKRLDENFDSSLAYFRELSAQLSQSSSGPFVPKTPKLLRKKAVQRIETIPENEVFETTSQRSSRSSFQSAIGEEHDQNRTAEGRVQRRASKKAAEKICLQQSLFQDTPPRRQSDSKNNTSPANGKKQTRAKRKKTQVSSDDDDDNDRSAKYSKTERDTRESTRRATKKKSEQVPKLAEKTKNTENKEDTAEKENNSLVASTLYCQRNTVRLHSKTSQDEEIKKINDEIVAPTSDTFDASVYEDAIGKPIPIMNSTLKHSFVKCDKVMNATVVLERISQEKTRKLNETVVLKKRSSGRSSAKSKKSQEKTASPKYIGNCNGLITDDESSPEMKKTKQEHKRETKREAITTTEDEIIPNTPAKTYLKNATSTVNTKEGKTGYKSNALFSPYAEESVRKRVKAFEQAVMSSPTNLVAVDAPTRMTRTKTRAMAAAETEVKHTDKNVAQILARKSVAKAKRISLAKQKKNNEESKENKELPVRLNKLVSNDKTNVKQTQQQQQQKTPLPKMTLTMPSSVNRIHTPLNTQNLLNYSKPLTASRTNIITTVESFIQPKSMTKTNSADRLDEEKKNRSEEDARKKRDETLRILMEEKKRKREQKELKNRLAREAKERQELEKRQKAEREKEEKAKLALMLQEKQREEIERKRFAQLQRAQEKEERRRMEEQQRLQRLQEQEETERLLAEQKRREQEAERRREAELRAQQQAAAEALRQKNLMLAQAAKQKQQATSKPEEGVKNYKLDSEPDDDESDDESRPKYEVPYWAQAHIRKKQLAMQQHIPQDLIFKFFDTRKCTPDLSEMFHGIDRSRLKRTSSAIWKTPPRISMMERIE